MFLIVGPSGEGILRKLPEVEARLFGWHLCRMKLAKFRAWSVSPRRLIYSFWFSDRKGDTGKPCLSHRVLVKAIFEAPKCL